MIANGDYLEWAKNPIQGRREGEVYVILLATPYYQNEF